MSPRTLAFVDRVADAGPPDPSTDIVVLDTTWTPTPGGRADLASIRPTLQAVIRSVDLFDGTLDRLDDWADAMDLPQRFMIGDVSWWNHVRIIIRWDVHELIMWRHVLDLLAPAGRYGTVVVPADRAALVAAARAGRRRPAGPEIRVVGEQGASRRPSFGWLRHWLPPRIQVVGRDVLDVVRLGPHRWRQIRGRRAILDARLDAIRASGVDVLSIASARVFQLVRIDGQDRFVEPNLAFALDRLGADGLRVATLAVAADHRSDADWTRIADDPGSVPRSIIRARYGRRGDDEVFASDALAGFEHEPAAVFEVGGLDLGPEVRSIVADYSGAWLAGQRRWTVWAERMLRDLAPRALFLDREDSRTMWTAAARRIGIPIVTTQHGVIYPNNPAYCHRPHRGVLLADRTCVFGTYERDVLTTHGLYDPASVVVTGSGRADPEQMAVDRSTAERAEVRRELGIADGDRLLVVSVANNPVGGDIHSVCMVERMLDGPLPGIHVVVKLHPIDRVGDRYGALLAGLARAGGYRATPLTVVRDIDLYRLLRAADAHLGQYSTVLTDAVVAGTPNMIAVGVAFNDHIGYEAARVAAPVRTVDDVRAFMADPRPSDPADRARFLAAHFQPGDAAGRIAAVVHECMLPVRGGAS